ncbi:MAG TPA: hypothetical protein VMZ71_09485, partial [Gemmataceae bacterium]|nr:hypothetical protein [Gemmataceae bacterium]
PDLWPSDLVGEATLTPVAILRRQGEALGGRTSNFVYGEVESRPVASGAGFEHTLVLIAPFLRFRFPLVNVSHGIALYPVQVAETDLTKPTAPGSRYWSESASTEAELRAVLQKFFEQERVKTVIRSLILQSNEPDSQSKAS